MSNGSGKRRREIKAKPSNHLKVAALWLLAEGKTQGEVAAKLGVHQTAVAYWAKHSRRIREQNDEDLKKHLYEMVLQGKQWST